MTVLSRLGPARGSSRPQLLQVSSNSLLSHLGHGLLATGSPARSPRSVPATIRNISVGAALETAVYDATQLITTLHTVTGTPWYITIPLAALAVNLTVRLPVTIYSRRLEQKRTRLAPLFWAWNSRITETVARDNPGLTHAQWTAAIQKKGIAQEKRIAVAHGVQAWRIHYLGPITAFPFFITAIQAVRRLCGAGGGLFSLFSNPLPSWTGGKEEGGKAASVEASQTTDGIVDQTSVDRASWTADVQSQAVAGPPTATATPGSLSSELLGYEPSLSTGGCLWFPDLTVADPAHVLPFMLSAAMLYVVLPRNLNHARRLLDPTATDLSWQTRLHRALLVIGMALGPLTMHLPAALHLYWITSTVTATTLRTVVEKMMPLPKNHDRPKGRDMLLVLPTPPPPAPQKK